MTQEHRAGWQAEAQHVGQRGQRRQSGPGSPTWDALSVPRPDCHPRVHPNGVPPPMAVGKGVGETGEFTSTRGPTLPGRCQRARGVLRLPTRVSPRCGPDG